MLNIQQFNYSQHPYLLPNFMDVFTWSIPFVGEKVMEMLYSIVKPAEGEEDKSSDDDDDDETMKSLELTMFGHQQKTKTPALNEKALKIQNKIKSVAKMLKLQKVLREKSEEVIAKKAANQPPPSLQMNGVGRFRINYR
jgi:serine/threonine-protein phosphatase 2B catalytic subunit